MVSPCPIFQLVKKTSDGRIIKDLSELGDVSLMVAHLQLLSPDDKDVSVINTKSMEDNPLFQLYTLQLQTQKHQDIGSVLLYERLLEGSTVSNCYFLTDLYGKKGAYFVFEDLSIRMEGVFKLEAIVNDISLYF